MRLEWKWMGVLVLVNQWYSSCYGCWEEERIALLHVQAFFTRVDGTPSYNLTGKQKDADCCKWSDQVECDAITKRVTRLSLNYSMGWSTQNQNQYLNASLFLPFEELKSLNLADHGFVGCFENQGFEVVSPRLRNLEVLDLSFNRFNDSILPSLSGFSSLKSLNLANNMMTGSTYINSFEVVSSRLRNLEVLDLSFNRFNVSILSSLSGFSSLKSLNLANNMMTGSTYINSLCKLKNLEELHLFQNILDGLLPACLGNLSSLRLLDVSDNRLQIPVSFNSFMNLSNLMHISCDNNILVAEPTSQNFIPKFQLQFFSLSNCSSKQELPNFLYSQYNLSFLDLSYSNFVGIFPSWLLENNTRIEEAHLEGNLFRGPLQLSYHPNFDIWALDLADNNIDGQIPKTICFIFPQLYALSMAGNEFTGSIPPCIGNMSFLGYLDLSDNHLSQGIPDQLAMAGSLYFVRLSNNNLEGEISRIVFFNLTDIENLYLNGNNFTGQISDISSNPSTLWALDISNNHLSGMLPRWIGNTTVLMAIDFSNNHFEGSILEEFCKLDGLEYFDLSENNLVGSIPLCFNPPRLSHVHLSKNLLTGPLTNTLLNSSSLVTLNLASNSLTGPIPNLISSLSTLSVLLLNANLFNSDFPVRLCLLKQLSILDLSQNKFYGPLPSCLSKLTSFRFDVEKAIFDTSNFGVGVDVGLLDPIRSIEEAVELTTKKNSYKYTGYILNFMSAIDLSCNRFTGEIPPEFGNLGGIHALNLSHNNLTGSIPTTFSNLKQIESLDLSHNNLNGVIPPQLSALYTLEVFSVAFNNLSGKTPERRDQFGTFDETSYEGNPFLCGPPLRNNCGEVEPVPSTEMPNDSNGERKDDGPIDMNIFYVSFGVSYVTVVVTIAAVLCINPHWRRSWFYFIEVCIETCYYFVLDSFHKFSRFRWL